jgi:hypothetical protein
LRGRRLLAVTLEGEFIAKNLVLVTALIVVATYTAKAKQAKAAARR